MPSGRGNDQAAAKKRRLDEALDKALQDSFPGSDPVSVSQPASSPDDKEENVLRPKARKKANRDR
jgi:hypothetical protein